MENFNFETLLDLSFKKQKKYLQKFFYQLSNGDHVWRTNN